MPIPLKLRITHPLLALLLPSTLMLLLGGCVQSDSLAGRDPAIKTVPIYTAVYSTDLNGPSADSDSLIWGRSSDSASQNLMRADSQSTDSAQWDTTVAESVPDVRQIEPSAANLQRAAEYSRSHDGDALIVMTADGRVLFEDYGSGAGPERPHRLASGTKTFWGLLAVAAAQDGLIDLDERVANTVTEWQSDPRKSRITVRQLLNFTSGLDPAIKELRGNPSSEDKFALALQVSAVAEPGATFAYGPSHLFAFGAWLQRKLRLAGRSNSDPLAYLKERLLDPIGVTIGQWTRDAAGHPIMPAGAFVAPREWIKIGQLIANKGRWQGRTLIEPSYLHQMFQGSTANPAYGLTLWLNKDGSANQSYSVADRANEKRIDRSDSGYIYRDGPSDLVMAAGQGKQRLYIIPSRCLVILRQGDARGSSWRDRDFLSILLEGKLEVGFDSAGTASQSAAGEVSRSLSESAHQVPRDLRRACRDDIQRLCSEAIGDRPALRRCYQEFRQDFSAGCQRAIATARDARRASPDAL